MKHRFEVVVAAALVAALALPVSPAFAGSGEAPKAGSATNGTKPEGAAAAGGQTTRTGAATGAGTPGGSTSPENSSQVGTKTPGGIIGK